MKLTVGQKAMRVAMFLIGLRYVAIAQRMAQFGLTLAVRRQGWGLVQALSSGRLNLPDKAPNPKLLRELDGWENMWFPIIEATLQANFPVAHEIVFRNLAQSSGAAVVFVVGNLISRIDGLSRSPAEGGVGALEAAQIKALLGTRGIDETILNEGRAMLAQLEEVEVDTRIEGITPEEEAAAEDAMWRWYLEWSAIARVVITDRRQLRALGFLRNASGQVVEDPTVLEPAGPTPVADPDDPDGPFTS
jgi:hypothetical protein